MASFAVLNHAGQISFSSRQYRSALRGDIVIGTESQATLEGTLK
jgi:hypothetical protein